MPLASTAKELAFLTAARTGHLDQVRKLVGAGTDLFVTTEENESALHLAAAAGHADVVRYLLEADTDEKLVFMRNDHFQLPTEFAAIHRHVEILHEFARLSDGKTLLERALCNCAERGDIQPVELLLTLGVDANATEWGESVLWKAAMLGSVDIGSMLMHFGADVDWQMSDSGRTALHAAASAGEIAVLDLLLAHGATVDTRGVDGSTPLHAAADEGHVRIVQTLIEHGADVNAVDETQITALCAAARFGHADIVAFLLQHNADTSVVDKSHQTLLHHAALGRSLVVQMMEGYGLDVNAVDKDLMTPLHNACKAGHYGAVSWLLDHGADVTARAKSGETALHFGFWHSYIVKMLLAHGIERDVQDTKNGATALHLVCDDLVEAEDSARQLLEHGFDVNRRDMDGQTPLVRACFRGHYTVAMQLLQHGADPDASDGEGSTALFLAIGNNTPAGLVREFVARGADPHQLSRGFEYSLLHQACSHSNLGVVRVLLEFGVDATISDINYWTALHHAVDNSAERSAGIVEALLEYGVDPHERRIIADDPLRMATEVGNVEVVRVFLEYAPFLEKNERYFARALETACADNHMDVATLLLEHGTRASYRILCAACHSGNVELVQVLLVDVEPTQRSGFQKVALHTAASNNHPTAIQLLVANGVDINEQDQGGGTALQAAAKQSHTPCVRLLLEHGADPNHADRNGWTALMYACMKNELNTVEMLVTSGADVYYQSPEGTTPLHVAAMNHSLLVVSYLIKLGVNVQARERRGGFTPMMRCIQRFETTDMLKTQTAMELVRHGATYDLIDVIRHEWAPPMWVEAFAFLVQWWVNERNEGKTLTPVPEELLARDRESMEEYLIGQARKRAIE
ncbi:hypothetical protein Poli38472_006171 [Pythium oligandrum]|uniref:Uncharacterized protein n=1 Tax=Pythium oligandrum TaxID=41045 RepID=A0A8K1CTL3_PYTOL|nr:hypothetical protein Poli38472_006171 [Pythium oligandrum]|eukprot:TMW68703.1 hypothetical protein Poli38472_006171 [Pythium oligandrum]